jgi:hypothetical protein
MSDAPSILVSVHLPKTAGTSFAMALRAHYGDRLVEDYTMVPLNRARGRREWDALRAGVAARAAGTLRHHAVHGHFLPLKYRLALRGHQVDYVTWLRDPVDRLLSHFHYWKRTPEVASPAQPLRYRFVREDWSLERFCLGPELRNVYRQYLWGFPPSRFAFIGITEHYDTELDDMGARLLGSAATLTRARARVNPDGPVARYPVSAALEARIRRHHAADVRLYAWALAQREKRLRR